MAVRLSVVMVHTAPHTVAAQRISEGVVGELIGLGGIDLTLVGPLARLSDSSTDRLSLGSLEGDVAVLDWQSPTEIIKAMTSIGFIGRRAAHSFDREPSLQRDFDPDHSTSGGVNVDAPPTRRIYCFDLNAFAQPAEVIEALQLLKQSRQVKTVSLGISNGITASGSRPVADPAPLQGDPNGDKSGEHPSVPGPPSEDHVRQQVREAESATTTPTSESHDAGSNSGTSDREAPGAGQLNLDALVDQLDAFDP